MIGKSIENTEKLVRKMPGICKWRHAPTGTLHTGSKWGYTICKLPHSSLCEGGVEGIHEKRMACPHGYKKGMVLDYQEDPRVDTTSDSEVSDQHSSQLNSETAIDDDDPKDVEKNVSLIDLIAEVNRINLGKKTDPIAAPKLSFVSLSTETTSSWSTASSMMPSLHLPAYSQGLFTAASSNPLLFTAPNLLLQQQVAEMKRQQQLQLERHKERDDQLTANKGQLEEAENVTREIRSEASVKSPGMCWQPGHREKPERRWMI